MKKIIFSVGILTLISKLTGFGREVSLSYFFGASEITDAYLIAITIPTVIFNFVGIGLSSTYIPMYSSIKEAEGEREAVDFTNNFLNVLLFLCTIVYVLGLCFTPQLVRLFASGFQGEVLELAIKYTRICFIGIYITVLISVFSGFLHVNNRFYAVALMSVPMNIIYIAGTYYASIHGDIYLPIISVIAIVAQLVLLLIPIKKTGYAYAFSLRLKDKNLKRILLLSIPTIIGGSLDQINYLVDKTIASRISLGGISILNYAGKLNIAIIGLFVAGMIDVLYPRIAAVVAAEKYNLLKDYIKKTINIIFLISLPIIFGILVFSYEIIEVIFGRGAFTQEAIQLTAKSLFYYTLGFLAIALRALIVRIYYSLKDTKTPVLNSAIGILLNIALNIVLSKYLGLIGIALATSISLSVTTLLLSFNLERKYHFYLFEGTGLVFLKTLLCSIGMACLLVVIKHYFMASFSYLLLMTSAVIGIFSYSVLIAFSNIEEVNGLTKILKERIKKM